MPLLHWNLPRVQDYLWVAEDGLKMQGYNGSQLWDTAFAAQAVADTGLAADTPEAAALLAKANAFVEASQVGGLAAGVGWLCVGEGRGREAGGPGRPGHSEHDCISAACVATPRHVAAPPHHHRSRRLPMHHGTTPSSLPLHWNGNCVRQTTHCALCPWLLWGTGDSGKLSPPGAVLSPHQRGGMALLHSRPWLAHL
jgi:hypothetical protein